MKPQILILILSSLILASCTREAPDMSRISLHIPESSAVLSKGVALQSVRSLSGPYMSKWALPAPDNYSEINCFAIMIHAPDVADEAGSCADGSENVIASPQYIRGGFLPDTDQSIEVPTGLARTIYLVGFHASSTAHCTDLDVQKFSSAEFSPPVILSERTVDLKGGDVAVEMSVPLTLASLPVFEDCAKKLFTNDVAPSEPNAEIDDSAVPEINGFSGASFAIGGAYTFEFQYAVVFEGAGNCSDADFTNEPFHPKSFVAAWPTLNDGNYDICVKARSASGKVQTVPSRKSWTRDTEAPTGAPVITLVESSPNNVKTPAVTVSAIPSGSTAVSFFTNINCGGDYAVQALITGTSFTVTLPSLADATWNFSAVAIDAAGNRSGCSNFLTYQLDTVGPSAPAALAARYATSLSYSPLFTWDPATDTGGSGVDRYQVAMGSGATAALMDTRSPWSSAGTMLSWYYIVAPLFVDTNQFYFSVRAIDAAGNIGSSLTQPFTVDMQADWEQQKYFKADDAAADDHFGSAVAIDGDYMVVGAASSDGTLGNITDSGAAYVYKRSGTDWAQVARLDAMNDRIPGDQFGYSVAISGNTIAIGAPYEDNYMPAINHSTTNFSANTGGTTDSGAVYIFTMDPDGTWNPQAYIKGATPANADNFGTALSLSNDKLFVGAPGALGTGAVYQFSRSGSVWSRGDTVNGATGDKFGSSISLYDVTLAIGAPGNTGGKGAVYISRYSGTSWSTTQTIVAPVRDSNDNFGASLQLFDGRLVIGAPGEDSNQRLGSPGASSNNSATDSGAAYLYLDSGTSFSLQKYFKSPNSLIGDEFGASVAIWGTTIVVGAPGEDQCFSAAGHYGVDVVGDAAPQCTNGGAVFVYQLDSLVNTDWGTYLKPTNAGAGANFQMGRAVAISGSAIAAGAKFESKDQVGVIPLLATSDSDAGVRAGSGAVYLYDVYSITPTAATILDPPGLQAEVN